MRPDVKFIILGPVVDPCGTQSNLLAAVTEVGTVAVYAQILKNDKCAHLDPAYMFVLVAGETCGSFGRQTKVYFRELGRGLGSATPDENSHQHLIF